MKMVQTSLILILIILLAPAIVFGQSTLRGVVTDTISQEKLIGVNVHLLGTSLGCPTNIEGEYRITGIPERVVSIRVSCVGYEAKIIELDFRNRKEIELNVQLTAVAIIAGEVIVTAQLRGQLAAINQQLTANTIKNIVSEEKIQELPDANAAEAIGRLPGVSLLRSGGEASKVVLRGLSDKYSVVMIDGIRMAPTDENERGVDLSTISQGSLAGIEISKALTADMDADAIAGSVNLVTKKAPSLRYLRFEPRGSYNAMEKSAGQYNLAARYGERFFDDRLGVQLSANLERTIRSHETTNLDYELVDIKSGNDYEITQLQVTYVNEIRKRGGGNLLLDYDSPDGGSIRLNAVINRTSRDYLTSYRTYAQSSGVSYDYRDRETDITTINTFLHGDNYLMGFKIDWSLSFSQARRKDPFDFELNMTESSSLDGSGNVFSGMRNVPDALVKGPVKEWIPYAMNNFQAAYINQANDRSQGNLDEEQGASIDLTREYTLGESISGEFKIGGKYRMKSRFAVHHEGRSNYYLYAWPEWTRPEDGTIVKKSLAGTRFENLKLTQGGLVIFSNFLDPSPVRRDVFGEYAMYPLINRDALRDWQQLNVDGVLDQRGAEAEYKNNFEIEGDDYDITERITAGYLMNTINFGRTVSLILGARWESDDNDYMSKYTAKPLSGFPFPFGELRDTTVSHTETTLLPNVQGIVRLFDFMNVRLAMYKALSRPDFNHRLLKFVARSASGNVLDIGNTDLTNAVAWNYEVQTQFFGNAIGLFSISAFYKDITHMHQFINGIPLSGQRVLDSLGIHWKQPFPTDNTIYNLSYPYNSNQPTHVWGFEVEHQTDLNFLPGRLKNIVLNYNFTIVRSETWISTSKVETTYVVQFPFPFPVPVSKNVLIEKKQKLQDQPEFFGNASLGYDIEGFSFRLSVFHQGSYNTTFSSNQRSDGTQDSYTRWDLALKQRVMENISIIVNLNNISNVQEGTAIANRLHSEWVLPDVHTRYGFTADVGVRIEF
ncbi:MAG: TonB-dependent receptor [bacterium]